MTRNLLRASMVSAAVLGFAGAVHAADLIAYDGFDYPVMVTLQLVGGGTGWTSVWHDLGALPTGVTTTGLTWEGLQTSGRAAATAPFPSADWTRYSRGFGPVTGNPLYISFLMRPDAGFGTGGGLAFGTLWPNVMIVGAHPGNYMYGLMTAEGLGADTSVPVIQGQTALMVLRMNDNGDGTITWSLWANPTVGQPEPAFPAATYTTHTTMPQAVAIFNDGGFTTDEIRVGHTWASVLPGTAPACPADFNQSGTVDGLDLGFLLGAWGTATADLNGDGMTNGLDLALLLGAWGPCH